MRDKLTIYYSVENCGDGSAYPVLFDTKELSEWHQDHDDGWGESCTGTIDVKGDNLSCDDIQTKEGYYLELLLDGCDDDDANNERKEFVTAFFPDGLPEFTVEIIDKNHYGIFVEDRMVFKSFAHPEKKANSKGAKKLTKTVNS